MAIVRISAGMYKDTVTGKTVKASDASQATKLLGGGKTSSAVTPQRQKELDRQKLEAENRAKKAGTTAQAGVFSEVPNTIENVQQGLQADKTVADFEAGKNIQLNNPNVNSTFGSQQVVQNPDGTYTLNQSLDPNQQKTVEQDTALSQMGRGLAQQRLGGFSGEFNPNLTARTSTGSLEGDRARIEEAVFGRLTKTTDRDFGREKEQMKQELFNRGIPLEEIESRPEMQALNERYDSIKEQARNNAIEVGGNEYSRNFGINEQMRANDYSQQLGGRQQNFGETASLSQYGQGAQLPQFQAYQGTNYDIANPTAINESLQNQDIARQNLGLQKKQVNAAIGQMGRGGGGGQPQQKKPAQESSPFQV